MRSFQQRALSSSHSFIFLFPLIKLPWSLAKR